MSGHPTDGALRPEDMLLGCLLAIDRLGERPGSSETLDGKWISRMVDAVASLVCLTEDRVRQGRSALPAGTPAWMVSLPRDATRPGGLGRVAEWLMDPDAAPVGTRPLLDEIRVFSDAIFGLASEDWAKVEEKASSAMQGSFAASSDEPAPARVAGPEEMRVCVPTVTPDARHGVVLHLGVTFRTSQAGVALGPAARMPRLPVSAWPEATCIQSTFAQAVRDGVTAGLATLRRYGLDEENLEALANVHVRILGLLHPIDVHEGSVALPIALATLRAGLGLSDHGYVASGGWGQERVSPLGESWSVKARAARAHGRELLAAYMPEVAPGPAASFLPPGPLTLEAVAAAAWPDWTERMAQAGRNRVRQTMHVGREPEGVASSADIAVVTRQEKELAAYFSTMHPAVKVLGGPPRSGKSWIAERTCEELEAEGWRTLTLRPLDRTLPSVGALVDMVRWELGPAADARPTLLVLEGLRSIPGADRLEEAILAVREELKISVLAVAEMRWHASAWRSDADSVTSVAGHVNLVDFVDRLVKAYPSLASARDSAPVLVRAAGGDLWLLVELVKWVAEHPENLQLRSSLAKAYLAQVAAGFSRQKREDARRAGAMSAWGLSLRPGDLGSLSVDDLQRLGAVQLPGGAWRIASGLVCEFLIDAGDETRENLYQIADELLVRAVETRNDELLTSLLIGVERWSDVLLQRVLTARSRVLRQWAMCVDAGTLAVTVRTVIELLSVDERRQLAQQLLDVLTAQYPDGLTVPDLTACLKLLTRHRHLLDGAGGEPGLERLVDVLAERGLGRVLDRHAGPSDRVGLLRALSELALPDCDRLIEAHAASFVRELSPARPSDYIAAHRAVEQLGRLHGGKGSERGRRLVHTAVEAQGMLERPQGSVTAGVLIGSLTLRLLFDAETRDWSDLVRDMIAPLRRAVHQTSANELADYLGHLGRFHRGLCVGILHRADLSNSLMSVMTRAAPSECARLVGTLAALHGATARSLLYEGDRPRSMILEHLATLVVRNGDLKGAGLLLSATAAVDDVYGTLHGGFAQQLAARWDRLIEQAMVAEPRGVIVYHLVRGLVAASATELLGRLRPIIIERLERELVESQRTAAPRLAMMLAGDLALGPTILDELAERFSDEALMSRLRGTRRNDTLAAYHELISCMRPDLARRYADEFDPRRMLPLLKGRPPEVVLRTCQAVAATLRRGGHANGAEEVLDVEADWGRRLGGARKDGDLNESLRILARLSPSKAATALERYRENDEQVADAQPAYEAPVLLTDRIARALFDERQGVELLGGLDAADHRMALAVVSQLQRHPGAWHSFTGRVLDIQDPTQLMIGMRRLIFLGWMPDAGQRATLLKRLEAAAYLVRSPRAAAALVRSAMMVEPTRAGSLAERLRISAIGQRIQEGARADLRSVWGLASSLHEVGCGDDAKNVLDHALSHEDLTSRLGLSALASTVGVAREVDHPELERLVARATVRLQAASQPGRVVDDVSHWDGFGWLAWHLRRAGATVPPMEFDRAVLGVAPRSMQAWATAWVPAAGWEAAVQSQTVPSRPDAAARLAATHLAAGRPLEPWRQWMVAAGAQPPDLLTLLEELIRSRAHGDFARELGVIARELMTHPGYSANFFARLARRQAERLLALRG